MKEITKVAALGGVEEIGKNMYLVEHKDEILIIDAGIKFANELQLGMNGTVPNFDYLKKTNKDIYLFITHGHEDHIGGVPYLLQEVPNIKKIYAPILSLELIKKKLHEFKLTANFELVDENSIINTKNFEVELFRVCHSIPDSHGAFIKTPNGNIVTAGDFRFDFCSDEQTDIQKIADLSKKDVTLFLCETTNSETPGFSESEINIIDNIMKVIKNSRGRIFISTFASNLSRIEKIIEKAVEMNRKICIIGRSMENNISIAKRIKFLDAHESDFISTKEIENYPDNELLFILTGSQGEEKSALSQIAVGQHPKIIIKETDTFLLSSNPIPGNFLAVEELVNKLYKTNATVLQHKMDGIFHASGHATTQEQQLMIKLVNPKYILPIHGEYKMLKTMKNMAINADFNKDSIIIVKNGDVVHMIDNEIYKSDEIINAEPSIIDGKRISRNSINIIKEREVISSDGIFSVIVCIDRKNKKILTNPQIATRGIFYVKDTISLLQKISYTIKEAIEKLLFQQENISVDEIKKNIEEISKFFIWKNKKKNPIITSTIFEK